MYGVGESLCVVIGPNPATLKGFFDATNRRLAYIRERDVYSAINNRMGNIEDFRKQIDKAPEGTAAVALMLLLGKKPSG